MPRWVELSQDIARGLLDEFSMSNPMIRLPIVIEFGLARVQDVMNVLDVDDGTRFCELDICCPGSSYADICFGDDRRFFIPTVKDQMCVRLDFAIIEDFLVVRCKLSRDVPHPENLNSSD